MDGLREKIAQRIRDLRAKQGYSVAELARRSKVSRNHIMNLEDKKESKKVTVETLQKIAAALKIPLHEFFKF